MQLAPAHHQAEVMAGSFFRKFIEKNETRGRDRRAYSHEEFLVTTIQEVADRQGRSPEAVVVDLAKWDAKEQHRQEKLLQCWEKLSYREQEITALVCLGYDRNQMAEKLSIGSETVKSHLNHIFRKLDVRTTRHIVAIFEGWNFAMWWDENPHT